jgi:mRNA-degrading endonuclease RelE of RelBE toxin-antitoxin system
MLDTGSARCAGPRPLRLMRIVVNARSFALQIALLLRPEQGPVIPGSGGLRKVRWAGSGRGKRGGLRMIYYWHPADETFYMLFAYRKNAQEDLTPAQLKVLRKLVKEELE